MKPSQMFLLELSNGAVVNGSNDENIVVVEEDDRISPRNKSSDDKFLRSP